MTTTRVLIYRLQNLVGPSRDADAEIYLLVSGFPEDSHRPGWLGPNPGDQHGTFEGRARRYTESVDAALTLIPPGWTRCVDASAPEEGIDIDLYPPDEFSPASSVRGAHAIEAIATAIAALRARLAIERGADAEGG